MFKPTLTAKQIKAKHTNSNVLNPTADASNARSLTPNYRTSNTFEDSSVIAYKDPLKHLETAASMKDFGLPRDPSRENNPTFKSKDLVHHISQPNDDHKYNKLKITQQDKPQPRDYEKTNIEILDAKKESAPDLLIDLETRGDYYKEKYDQQTPQRIAISAQLSMKHSKLDYDWNHEHKMPVKVDRGLTFVPNYQKISPREQRRQALYNEESLKRSPRSSYYNISPKKKEKIADSPKARKKFVDMKRQKENSSSVFLSAKEVRSKSPVILGNRDTNLEICPVDCKWNDRLAHNKYKNFSSQFEPGAPANFAAQKRTLEHSSNIFHHPDKEKKAQESAVATRISGPDFQDHENEKIRRKEHNFSDIFNLSNYHPQKVVAKNVASIPTTVDFTNSQFEAFSAKPKNPKEPYDIKEKKLAERVSVLDTESIKTNAEQFKDRVPLVMASTGALVTIGTEHKDGIFNARGEEYAPEQENPDHTKNMLKTFNLTAIPKSIDEKMLKKLFAGFHLVDLECGVNKLTNKPLGNGEVKIRSDDVEALKKLQQKLKQIGIYITPKETKTGLRNNYNVNPTLEWLDNNLEREEKRIDKKKNKVPAKIAKRKDLQSEGEAFGNSEGHGKWPTDWDADGTVKMTPKKDHLSTAHWNHNFKKSKKPKEDLTNTRLSVDRPKSVWRG